MWEFGNLGPNSGIRDCVEGLLWQAVSHTSHLDFKGFPVLNILSEDSWLFCWSSCSFQWESTAGSVILKMKAAWYWQACPACAFPGLNFCVILLFVTFCASLASMEVHHRDGAQTQPCVLIDPLVPSASCSSSVWKDWKGHVDLVGKRWVEIKWTKLRGMAAVSLSSSLLAGHVPGTSQWFERFLSQLLCHPETCSVHGPECLSPSPWVCCLLCGSGSGLPDNKGVLWIVLCGSRPNFLALLHVFLG